MTEEGKKAIEYFTKRIDICNENANICDENNFDEEAIQLREEQKMTETILNLIQSQQKEIECLKQAGEAKETVYKMQLEKKDKIIDEMANNILTFRADTILPINIEGIKQYFEKKVEGK